MIRAANTGISAVIDSNGNRVARLDTGEAGAIDAGLSGARAPTPCARFGGWTALLLIVACWSVGWLDGLFGRCRDKVNSGTEES